MATAAVLHFSPTLSFTATPQLPPSRPQFTRRRTTPQQGRALEMLGHAVEYLVDSRLPDGGPLPSENHAIRILMACSREVFEESELALPVHQRVGSWMQTRFRRIAAATASF